MHPVPLNGKNVPDFQAAALLRRHFFHRERSHGGSTYSSEPNPDTHRAAAEQ